MTKGAAQETGLDDLAKDFIVENNAYYQTAFAKIQRASSFRMEIISKSWLLVLSSATKFRASEMT